MALVVAALLLLPVLTSFMPQQADRSADERRSWVLSHGIGDPAPDMVFEETMHGLVEDGIVPIGLGLLGNLDARDCDQMVRLRLRAALTDQLETSFFHEHPVMPVVFGGTNARQVLADWATPVDMGPVFNNCEALEIQAGPITAYLGADVSWMRQRIVQRRLD